MATCCGERGIAPPLTDTDGGDAWVMAVVESLVVGAAFHPVPQEADASDVSTEDSK